MRDTPAFPDMQRLQLVNHAGLNDAQREKVYVESRGMSLRDYFAASVAAGAMSEYWNGDRMKDPTFDDIAKQAYGIADAMLKARKA